MSTPTRPWDKPRVGDPPCKPGDHKPLYTKAVGAFDPTYHGAPADTYNRCKVCGIEIYYCDNRWVIDTGERQRWETGEKKKGFVFVELVREVVCTGPGLGMPCPTKWTTTTKSVTMKRCPRCQVKYRSFRASEVKRARAERKKSHETLLRQV